jgi:hypothetical protein
VLGSLGEYNVASESLRRFGERQLRTAVTVKTESGRCSNEIIDGLSKKISIWM